MKKIRLAGLGLAITVICAITGCKGREIAAADVNPDTPAQAVAFPLLQWESLEWKNGPTTFQPSDNPRRHVGN